MNRALANLIKRWTWGASALIASACSSTPPSTHQPQFKCLNFDWFEEGRLSGERGSNLETIERFALLCPDEPGKFNAENFRSGRELGLREYCTPKGGFEAGKIEAKYQNVCPEFLESAFLTGYKRGQVVSQLSQENQNLKVKMQSLIQDLAKSISEGNQADLRSQLDELNKKFSSNDKSIQSIETSSQ